MWHLTAHCPLSEGPLSLGFLHCCLASSVRSHAPGAAKPLPSVLAERPVRSSINTGAGLSSLCRNFPRIEQVYDIEKCEIEVGENIGQVGSGIETGVGTFGGC